MKKLIFTLLALFAFTGIMAQKIGAKVGINLATLRSDADGFNDSKKTLLAFQGGLVLEKKLVPFMSLQGEVLFSQKGLYNKYDEGYDKTIVNWLEIPISAKLKVGPTPLYFLVGPYFGYAMNGEVKIDDGNEETSDDIDWDVYKMKRFDYGVHAGMGMKFGPIFIEGRYGMGLADLNDNEDVDSYYKNSVFGISAGVIF